MFWAFENHQKGLAALKVLLFEPPTLFIVPMWCIEMSMALMSLR